MSKTYSDQVNKAKVLVARLKKNYVQIRNRGISIEELSKLESTIAEAEKLNNEVERLHSEINETSMQANRKLIAVKEKALEFKRIVKRYIGINKWADFGVMDKR